MNLITESLEKHGYWNSLKNIFKYQQNMILLSLYPKESHFNQNFQLNLELFTQN